MKNLALIVSLIAVSLGFSSCCSMFGRHAFGAESHYETHRVQACGYDIVTKQVVTSGSAKSGKGGMVQTYEERVPRYKMVTKRVWDWCGPCVHTYCPLKVCCGTTSDSTRVMASAQGSSGSPNLGLIPTMKPIAP